MVKIDLVNRTIENDGATPIVLLEVMEKTTTIPAGETVTLDPSTKAIKI